MRETDTALKTYIYPYLPPSIVQILQRVKAGILTQVTEIRLRVNQPLSLVLHTGDVLLSPNGESTQNAADAYRCTQDDLVRTLQMMSRNSVYAMEKELQQGFLTLNGGHRVGLAGQAIVENNRVKTLKNICAMNIRLAKEIRGCADKIMPHILSSSGSVFNTLLISPPRCGKTTILRDIARQLSEGIPALHLAGLPVGIVDERSEIAACQDGVPTVNVGLRTDVLDGCPKAEGMLMLIRSMASRVIITDELGRREDAEAIQEALHAGVNVIASVHGRSISDIRERPFIGELIHHKYFERFVIVGNSPKPGTLEEIHGALPGEILFTGKKEVKICG
jgi:stage III sporulation protein AA